VFHVINNLTTKNKYLSLKVNKYLTTNDGPEIYLEFRLCRIPSQYEDKKRDTIMRSFDHR